MFGPFTALCQAAQALVEDERANLLAGTHRPGQGPKEERIAARAARLRDRDERAAELSRLRGQALAAARATGFHGETVRADLDALVEAAVELTRWERGLRPVTGADDEPAEGRWWHLHGLVEAALGRVRDLASAAGEAGQPQPQKPRWDGERRELWFAGQVCKRFRQQAANQERILKEFEEAAWPTRIDDPLPGGCADPGQRLRDAIRGLNNKTGGILFEQDGTGEGILWRGKPP